MTKQDKLTKLIEIAEKNGYVYGLGGFEIDILVERFKDNPAELLFDHDFAKAIWGEEDICTDCATRIEDDWEYCMSCADTIDYDETLRDINELPRWKHYLQQAVISKDPLEYYWENK